MVVIGTTGVAGNAQSLEILSYVIVLVAVYMVNVQVFSFIT